MAKALNPFNKKAADIPPKVQVKGNAESVYRTGNVNLTPANIGAAGAPLWTTATLTKGVFSQTNITLRASKALGLLEFDGVLCGPNVEMSAGQVWGTLPTNLRPNADIFIYNFLSIEGGGSGEGFPVPAIIKANGQLVCGWKTRSWGVGLDGSYQDLYGVHCMVVMSGRGSNWPAV